MKTTRERGLDWYNKLPKLEQEELALDYYGCILLMDSEVEVMYLKEVPEEKMYSEQELRTLCTDVFNLGMEFRMKRLNGDYKITVEEVVSDFFANNLK